MTAPWHQDISYSFNIVKDLISKHTDISLKSLKLLGNGWDNVVYLINDKYIIRLVKKEAGVSGSVAENFVFARLPAMPLPIPHIIYKGLYQHKWPWIIYPIIEGIPLYESDYGESILCNSTDSIALFLKVLHGENVQDYEDLRGDFNNHMNIEKRIEFAEEKIQKLSFLNIIQPDNRYYDLLIEARSLIKSPYSPTICHGDFKSAHILFHKKKVSGIIDWGDTHIGHPSTDLAIIYSFIHPSKREEFKKVYESTDETIWKLAQFRAFWHSLAILEYTFSNKIKNRFENTLKSLENIFL
jgi:aminoglycoside phosphotransferase (APT) family kinase protein